MNKSTIILFTLLALISSFVLPVQINAEIQDDWIIQGDKVYIDDVNVYLSATPAVLGSSGWVEFEIQSKNYQGEIDAVWGFDTLAGIVPSEPQIWRENVAHQKTRYVPAEVLDSITLENISSWKMITGVNKVLWDIQGKTADLGNENNTKLIELVYDSEMEGTTTLSIAFSEYIQLSETSATFYYLYDGQTTENYVEYYDDWKPLNKNFSSTYINYKGTGQWKAIKLDAPVERNKLYKLRCWVEIPFKGNQTVSGKYNWAVKPSSETMQEAITRGHFYLLDPWYNAAWTYRKEITITGSVDGNLTNYQMPLDVNYGAGVDSGLSVFTASKCNTTFQDIRFTQSDGETLIDYWLEEYTAADDATFWVEFPTLTGSPTNNTYYMYYGNVAPLTTSNGTATFIAFDDYEWGSDGDSVATSGGSLTWTAEGTGATEIDTAIKWGGTRSMKHVGAAAWGGGQTNQTASSNAYAIRYRMYKETAAEGEVDHGNGVERITVRYDTGENILYGNDTAYIDTGSNIAADTWVLLEFNNIAFATPSFKIVYNNGAPISCPDMNTVNWNENSVMLRDGWNNAVGRDVWFDDYIVRNWTTNEPTITSWGTAGPPSSTTDAATNVTDTTAWFHATVDGDGGQRTDVRFQYNTTDLPCNCTNVTSYSTSTVWVNDTYLEGDSPYNVTTGLTPSTAYCYRVQIANDNATVNGTGVCFTTTAPLTPPTQFKAYPYSHNTSLEWIPDVCATGTLIKAQAGSYPANVTDGVEVYNSTNVNTVYSPLTPGITYYYRAWGVNGTTYSADYTEVMSTTTAGASAPISPTDPDTPSTWFSTPDYTNMDNMPLYGIINEMADDYGATRNTVWTLLTIVLIMTIGIIIYSVAHNPVIAIVAVGILMWIASVMGLIPLWLLAVFVVPSIGIMMVARRT